MPLGLPACRSPSIHPPSVLLQLVMALEETVKSDYINSSPINNISDTNFTHMNIARSL